MNLSRLLRRRATAAAAEYYPSQPTCQIRGLSDLLSQFLGRREHGCFVEVGAYDGVFVSNTWGLAARGWTGLMIEPVPDLAAKCRANHAAHRGVTVLEKVVGARDGDTVDLHVAGTLTTANPDLFERYKSLPWARDVLTPETLQVSMVRLDTALEEHAVPAGFDLLCVDVEGYEEQVFAGLELDRWKPRMIIVELVDTHPDLWSDAASDAQLGHGLQQAGYTIVYKDAINTVLVRDEAYWELLTPSA